MPFCGGWILDYLLWKRSKFNLVCLGDTIAWARKVRIRYKYDRRENEPPGTQPFHTDWNACLAHSLPKHGDGLNSFEGLLPSIFTPEPNRWLILRQTKSATSHSVSTPPRRQREKRSETAKVKFFRPGMHLRQAHDHPPGGRCNAQGSSAASRPEKKTTPLAQTFFKPLFRTLFRTFFRTVFTTFCLLSLVHLSIVSSSLSLQG